MSNASELSLFSLVVEAQSFNKAAEVAGMSTPALSKRITKLEASLGVQLLHRTTRRLNLTEAGKTLYDHAKHINRHVNEAVDSVSDYSAGFSGTIKMTVPTISGELLLAEAVSEFVHKHPDLTVEMNLENDFVDLIKDGVDLAIRTGELEDSSLIAKKLIQSNWVVCCSPFYLEVHQEPQVPDELKAHNCLVYAHQGKQVNEWRFSSSTEQFAIKVNGNFSADSAQALRRAALSGYGLVYVPRCSVYEDLQAGRLVALLTQFQARSIGVYAVYPYTRHQPEKIKKLIEHLGQAYQKWSEYF